MSRAVRGASHGVDSYLSSACRPERRVKSGTQKQNARHLHKMEDAVPIEFPHERETDGLNGLKRRSDDIDQHAGGHDSRAAKQPTDRESKVDEK